MMSPRLNGLRPTSSGRTSIVPSPRPVAITGRPPRRSRAGTMLARSRDQQHAAGDSAGVDDPADQPVGGAHRHADRDAVAGPDREDGEAARAAERRADDPPGGDRFAGAFAQLQRAFSLLVLLEDRLGLDHPPQASRRSRFSSPFWLAASQ